MPKSSTVMNSRYDEMIILLIFFWNRKILILIMILLDLLGYLLITKYGEMIILLIFLGSQDPISNLGSLGSFGMSFDHGAK